MTAKVSQMRTLLTHSLSPATRTRLAELLAQASTLAGWAALDLGKLDSSWRHHEHAKAAAREADSAALLAHATAQQAVILLDLTEHTAAVDQLATACSLASSAAPPALRAWLAAAHGEGLAHAGHEVESLRAFDLAQVLWPFESRDPELPYVFLGAAHLNRWRGHALTRLGNESATTVLTSACAALDNTFTRARLTLLLDLAETRANAEDQADAQEHLSAAEAIAIEIGSHRLYRRLRKNQDLRAGRKHSYVSQLIAPPSGSPATADGRSA